jgi:hypothetical protein
VGRQLGSNKKSENLCAMDLTPTALMENAIAKSSCDDLFTLVDQQTNTRSTT